jgi:peptide deformylase
MAERDILQLGNPLLWQQSASVTKFDSIELRALVDDLVDTLAAFRRRNGFGRAIAAPQIGKLLRVICVRMPDGSFENILVNPRICLRSERSVEVWDNCFSFPRLMVKVSRNAKISVEYQDIRGTARQIDAADGLSELLQHEIDHLDGVLATDRAISPRAIMTRQEYLWQQK